MHIQKTKHLQRRAPSMRSMRILCVTMRSSNLVGLIAGAVFFSTCAAFAQQPIPEDEIVLEHYPSFSRSVTVFEATNLSKSFEIRLERDVLREPNMQLSYVKINGAVLTKNETVKLSSKLAEMDFVRIGSVSCIPRAHDESLCEYRLNFEAEPISRTVEGSLYCDWRFAPDRRENIICSKRP